LVNSKLLLDYDVSVLDSQMEGILWLKLMDKFSCQSLCVCVCYLPPASSSRGDCSEEFFDCLAAQISMYRNLGTICICGDFNARCGELQDVSVDSVSAIPPRKPLDVELNSHGKQLMDVMKSLELGTLNGRGKDNFTFISSLGRSVVDYCIVELEDYNKFSHFTVTTMQELIEELDYQDSRHIPDHSLLSWQIQAHQLDEVPTQPSRIPKKQVPFSTSLFDLQSIPSHFMENRREEVDKLIMHLDTNTLSQELIDETYSHFCNIVKEEMECTLPKIRSRSQKHHHHKPWWNQELSEARAEVAKAERKWLTCENRINRPILRENYKATRRKFDSLVRRAKRRWCNMAGEDLDTALLGNQQGFWHKLKRHTGLGRKKSSAIPMEVLDGQRMVTDKDKVIEKWRNDFAALLNANSSIPHGCTTGSEKVCEAEMPPQLSELISPEVSEGSWEVIVSGDIVKRHFFVRRTKKQQAPMGYQRKC